MIATSWTSRTVKMFSPDVGNGSSGNCGPATVSRIPVEFAYRKGKGVYPLQGNVPLRFVGIFWREIGFDFGGKRGFRSVRETAGFLWAWCILDIGGHSRVSWRIWNRWWSTVLVDPLPHQLSLIQPPVSSISFYIKICCPP